MASRTAVEELLPRRQHAHQDGTLPIRRTAPGKANIVAPRDECATTAGHTAHPDPHPPAPYVRAVRGAQIHEKAARGNAAGEDAMSSGNVSAADDDVALHVPPQKNGAAEACGMDVDRTIGSARHCPAPCPVPCLEGG